MAAASVALLGRASEFARWQPQLSDPLKDDAGLVATIELEGITGSSINLADLPRSTSESTHNDTAVQLALACLTDGESESEADETEDLDSQLPFTYRCTNSIVGMPVARALPSSPPPLSLAMLLRPMCADHAGLISEDAVCTFGLDSDSDASGRSMSFGTPFAAVPSTMATSTSAVELPATHPPAILPTMAAALPQVGSAVPPSSSSKTNQRGYRNQAHSRNAFEAAPAEHYRKRTRESTGFRSAGRKQTREVNANRRVDMHQKDSPTTICFRNIPNNYSTQMVLDLLNKSGFENSYDFVYVPHDFKRLPSLVNVGYFFVNFVSHAVAESAMKKLVGFRNWAVSSRKVLTGSWAERTQGKAACIERCKYFTFMHNDIPNTCKPMMFERGMAVLGGSYDLEQSSAIRCVVQQSQSALV